MPRFTSESGATLPMDGVTYNYQGATMSVPSGDVFDDAEVRQVADVATTLYSEVQYSPGSGLFGIATETSGWITMPMQSVWAGSGTPPDQVASSGDLVVWARDNGIVNITGSGIASVTDESIVSSGTVWSQLNTPNVASGFQNGRDAMFFNGTNDALHRSLAYIQGTNPAATIIGVVHPTANTASTIWGEALNSNGFNSQVLVNSTNNVDGSVLNYFKRNDTSSTSATTTIPWDAPGTTRMFSILDDGTSCQIWVDGVEQTVAPSGTTVGALNNNNRMAIGARRNLTTDSYYPGGVLEMIVFDVEISDAERQDIEAYLTDRWAL